jgi:soluble lytic murein transglycosylase-like protein
VGFATDKVFGSLLQQESGGRPGIRGPQTKYGQAVGIGQTLPETAHAMAAKLGLPWQPDLLTGTNPAAADYQTKVSRAYFDEGLAKTGNVRDALHYYHGGPNRRQWGPKTQAYADAVLGRLGGR